MAITQHNYNKSLASKFKWASFEERNNLDELINLPTKAAERSMIQISFRTQDRHNPEVAPKFTADPQSTVFSKFVNPLDLPLKSTISALFKAKSVNPKTYSPPSRLVTTILNLASLFEIPFSPWERGWNERRGSEVSFYYWLA